MQFQQNMALQMGITVVDASTRICGLGWNDFHDWIGHLACTPKCVQFVHGLIETAERKAACAMPPQVMQAVNYLGLLPRRDIPNVTLEPGPDDVAIPRIVQGTMSLSYWITIHIKFRQTFSVSTSKT